MLLMKKRFFDAVRSGAKTTTLRYWRRCMVRPGRVRTVPGLGKVHINSAEPVDPSDLTENHARADGFESVGALLEALNALYPPAGREGRKLYLVRFTYLPGADGPAPRRRR